MSGGGGRYTERQWERVHCLDCGKDLERGSLVAHRQTQNGVAKRGSGKEGDEECGGDNPRKFRMLFLAKAGPRPCPVKGCSCQAETRTEMRVQFWHWHVHNTVVILEEGNLPHPRCPLCDMLVPWWSLNGLHRRTAQCKKRVERKQRNLALDEEKAVNSRAFKSHGVPIEMVTSFQCLGRVILAADDDWPVVVQNL